ncbi:MAG: diacylglycerol kinase family protein [Thiogranum sp.]
MNTNHPANSRPTIGLISNPHSRRNRSQLAAVKGIVANHPNIHHHITQSADEIPLALRGFAQRGVDVLAVNGGDGTTAQVFSELLEQRPFAELPSVILLPGGTTNMNVGDVGLRGKLTGAVRRMTNWAEQGSDDVERLTRPILRAEGSVDGKIACGMFFGTGTIIGGIEYCHNTVHSMGIIDELGPGVVTIRTIWGIARKEPYFSDPTPIRIEFDSATDTQTRQVVLLLISSLERLFLGLRPYWGVENAPLHCTWMQQPTRKVFRAFPSVLRGRPNRHAGQENGYFSHNAREIRLWIDGAFTLDGEIYHASTEHGPVTVSNGGDIEFIRIGR